MPYSQQTLWQIFFTDGSYTVILKGLLVTLEISVFSIIAGTILAAIVCLGVFSRFKILRYAALTYIAALRGTPVLMLLMLMYYVVLAGTGLPAVLIAVAAFSLNASAHLAELMKTSLEATDNMENEAARTLGMTRFQAFRLITLPQAVKIGSGMFQSLTVNLIQWTSVVGYVTITDLARAVNMLGARTMRPLPMIVIGMMVYLASAYLVYAVFAVINRIKIAKRKKRISAK